MRCDEGKSRYAERDVAETSAFEITRKKRERGLTVPDLRVYLCPFCERWHLTSAPKRDRWAWQMSGSGANPDLYARLLQRRRETPIFDALLRASKLRLRAFR